MKVSEQSNTIQSLLEEKKSLMNISNKLRAKMMRIKDHTTPTMHQRGEEVLPLPTESIQNTTESIQNNSDNSECDIEGFAKTLLTKVIGESGTVKVGEKSIS